MIWRGFAGAFRTILSDRSALLLLIGSAILYSFFYPTAYSGEVPERMPVVSVDLDHSGSSRSLTTKLAAVQSARLVARLSSPDEAAKWIADRRASAAVVIPAGFEQRILRGEQGNVALYGNGAYLLRSSTALAGVGSAIGAFGLEAATGQAMALGAPAPPPLALIQRPLFNTREGYGSTIFPGVAFLIIHQTLLMGLALLAGTIRERHGMRRLAPATLLGVALAFFVIGCADVAYFTGFVFWFQDYPRAQGNIGVLLVSAAAFIAATVAGALALASFFRTRERPIQLWIVTSVPIFFLSGLSWPVEATPDWLAMLGRLLPTTPGIHLMVGVNQMGASLTEQWPELVNLLGLTLLYGTIAFLRLGRWGRREAEKGGPDSR
ncbi:ABC transporter permease [Sphingomonas koreensis]|uniref:ABC transporter permease n=1 Tax=Sphingomonas koreensis TaxID=93064 RepID=UPI00082B7FCC|nr:ABC transporter permease [Sphingomonas koreensis]PJI90524.1 ABC-2 type transport system permease protein [Sphingomonas koreensis]RSU59031.1 ABC transporter permease [Sphingomonas koreensis]RSU67584.1 ABC transporter permease [Sphingomonas koreensis]